MKTQKIELNGLQVSSFVTTLENKEQKTIGGGVGANNIGEGEFPIVILHGYTAIRRCQESAGIIECI